MKDTTLVKYGKGKNTVEILCKKETVIKYRDGKLKKDKILVTDIIYSNSSKGNQAKDKDLIALFGTTNNDECIDTILKHGIFQLSSKELKDKRDLKKYEFINYIHKHYQDPNTSLPYSTKLLEEVIDKLHISWDDPSSTDNMVKKYKSKITNHIRLKEIN